MNNRVIDKITIQNFKSIRELTNFKLNNINILIGANGAGKSNFIKFFTFIGKFLHDDWYDPFDAVNKLGSFNSHISQKGGIDAFLTFGQKNSEFINCFIHVTDDKSYQFGIKFIPTLNNTFEWGMSLNHETQQSIFHLLKKIFKTVQVFHFHDSGDSSPLKKVVGSNDNLFLRSDGANIMGMITYIHDNYPEQYKLIVSTIKIAIPDFYDFVFRDGVNIQLEWFSKYSPDIPLLGHFLSDGSLRFIALTVLLLMPEEKLPNVIIIDEPELGLHPHALNIITDLIHRLSLKRQFIISTQSADFINYFATNDIVVVDKQDDGTSKFNRLSDKELEVWLEDYTNSDLWNMNIIGGQP